MVVTLFGKECSKKKTIINIEKDIFLLINEQYVVEYKLALVQKPMNPVYPITCSEFQINNKSLTPKLNKMCFLYRIQTHIHTHTEKLLKQIFYKLTVESSVENLSSLAAAASLEEQNSYPSNKSNIIKAADTKELKHKANCKSQKQEMIPLVEMKALFLAPSPFLYSNLKNLSIH